MIHDQKHLKFTAQPNDNMYWERVNRSLGWLGNPSLADKSIGSQSTIEEAIATLRACSPKPAYLITGGKQTPVDFVGYTKRPHSIYVRRIYN